MAIRLYTDEQRNNLSGGSTTNIPSGKIRLYSDEQRTAFQKIGNYNSLIEDAWKIEEETQQTIKSQTGLGGIFKGTVGLGEPGLGAVGKIGKKLGEFGKSLATRPGEVVKGAFESAVLKPIDFLQRTVQPNRLPEPTLTPEQRETPFEELRKKGTSKYVSPLAKPKDKQGEQARQVGEFLGWLVPYSAISKTTGLVIKGVTSAPKITKLIPLISDAVGFIGTGQVLHEEGSRLKQLRNDAIALGIFKSGALLYRGLKPTKTITGEINNLLKDTKDLFARPKKIFVKDLNKIESQVVKINNLIKEETGLTSKELLQKEIPQAQKRLYTDAQRTALTKAEPLAQEARKYKSAEEFANKSDYVYQGIGKGKQSDFLTTNINEANAYATQRGLKGTGEIRVYKFNDLPNYIKTITKESENYDVVLRELGKDFVNKPLTKQQFSQVQTAIGFSEKEIAKLPLVAKIKNQQQLTDIYTQATKGVAITKPVKPKGKPSGVALSVEAKAIEKGLTKKFKDLAEFTPTTIKKQAKKMAKEMKDVENVKGMVRGDVPLPEGLSPSTVIATMEEHALKTKDGELMAELAKSPLLSRISTAAQELSLMSQREKESAVAQIKSVIKTREKGVEQKLKFKTPEKIQSTMKKSLDKEIAKTKPTKHSWEQLMEDIKC